MKNDYRNLVIGENKNLTGIIFLIGTLMGFFYNTRRADIDDVHTFYLLMMIILASMILSRI
jgi:hypothetical protein